MRALVTGWFSFVHGEATAGDLLAAETATDWLDQFGLPYDVALTPVFESGVLLDDVNPRDYTHLLFVCGPLAGWQVEELLQRFAPCVRIAIGVSVLPSTPTGFDVVISRDGPQGDRPDLSLGADRTCLPSVVGVVRAHAQNEYPDARHDDVHAVIDGVLRSRDIAVVEVDTRVDPRRPASRRSEDVEALLSRVDAVVTTRMHGLVLALRHGVPAVAVDVVPGGAKVARQAAVLGWPAVLTADDLTAESLADLLDWALSGSAAANARRCADAGRRSLEGVREAFYTALRDTDGTGDRPITAA